jgi:hypothetical protein
VWHQDDSVTQGENPFRVRDKIQYEGVASHHKTYWGLDTAYVENIDSYKLELAQLRA